MANATRTVITSLASSAHADFVANWLSGKGGLSEYPRPYSDEANYRHAAEVLRAVSAIRDELSARCHAADDSIQDWARTCNRYRKALEETAEHCYCDLHKKLAREALAEEGQ